VTAETAPDLPALANRLVEMGITRWSLSFLISAGRDRIGLTGLVPAKAERLFRWLSGLSSTVPFVIKTTEGTQYRRVALKRMRKSGMDDETIARSSIGRAFGIRDGNGIMFVSHAGEVYPSGFLPLVVGNVRRESIVSLYQSSPVFSRIRDVTQLKGKCGTCTFAGICGGSRARAYAATGDYMESDPLCQARSPVQGHRLKERSPGLLIPFMELGVGSI
jgi:radical SAM protein with 4Fe4S-binding SPASM domain